MPKFKSRLGTDGHDYPYTSEELVFDENGNSIKEKINKIDEDKADKTEVLLREKLNDNGIGADEVWSANKTNSKFNEVAAQFQTVAIEKADKSDLNTQKSRIDNLASNTGTAVNDLELQDIRIGADGVPYPNAGDAVREQLKEKEKRLKKVESISEQLGKYVRLDVEKSIGLTTHNTLELRDSYTANSTFSISVLEGEKYKITAGSRGLTSGVFPSYIFVKDGVTVSYEYGDFEDYDIVIPKGVNKLYVNGYSRYASCISKFIISDVNDYVVNTSKKNIVNLEYKEMNIQTSQGTFKYENRLGVLTNSDKAYYSYVVLDVSPGEKFLINVLSIGATMGLYDSTNYNVASYNGTEYNNFELIIPTNVYKLVINAYEKDRKLSIKREVEVNKFGNNSTSSIINVNFTSIVSNNKKEKYEYLLHDNFHRADNVASLGNNGDNNNDFSYTQLTNNIIGIKSNSAYVVNTNTSGNAIAYNDKGVSNCILDFGFIFDNNDEEVKGVGIAFRISDNQNYWYTVVKKTSVRTYKVVAGVLSQVDYIYTISTDGVEKISVELENDKISILINGNLFSTIYDDFNKSETKHGLAFVPGTLSRIKYFDMRVLSKWYKQSDALDKAILPFYIKKEHSSNPYNFNFVTDITNGSNYANRFECRKVDNYKRSELSFMRPKKHLGEQFISWDCMLGEDFRINDIGSEIIMQFHDSPDNDDWTLPYASITPDVSLGIKNGEYYIHRQWASKKQAIQSELSEDMTVIGSCAEDIGKWVKWTAHIKWGYEKFFEPITEIYKDGELVYCANGLPNCVNGALSPYFKCGVYKYEYVENPDNCVSTSRTMWIDNIEVYY